MLRIDLNADVGESFGAFRMGNDESLFDFVSSANVACGFHGGDPTVMHQTVKMAIRKNVSIGAHPGYPDLQGFGRRAMSFSPEEIYDLVVYQVAALSGFVKVCGGTLEHVKLHGALYNIAAKDPSIASAAAHAVRDVDRSLKFTGLFGSCMITEAQKAGLQTIAEAFADRAYDEDGSLVPRTVSGSTYDDPARASAQALMIAKDQKAFTLKGKSIEINAQTICIHGDGKHAIEFARRITETLGHHGVEIRKPF